MKQSKLVYTQEELLELKKLAKDILENIDNMELEEIKNNIYICQINHYSMLIIELTNRTHK